MKTARSFLCWFLILFTSGVTPAAFAHPAAAQDVTITQVFKQTNPEDAKKDVILQRIELLPEAAAKPHIHPGMVTGYVISGTLEFQVEGQPLLTLHAGDPFFEPPGSRHVVARNPSKTEKTVIVAFVVNPKDQPVAQPIEGNK